MSDTVSPHSECGKTTILKQMKILNLEVSFSDSERQNFRDILRGNLLTCIITLCEHTARQTLCEAMLRDMNVVSTVCVDISVCGGLVLMRMAIRIPRVLPSLLKHLRF